LALNLDGSAKFPQLPFLPFNSGLERVRIQFLDFDFTYIFDHYSHPSRAAVEPVEGALIFRPRRQIG
jgi:hypothetical protein